jgi:hypothetical protein
MSQGPIWEHCEPKALKKPHGQRGLNIDTQTAFLVFRQEAEKGIGKIAGRRAPALSSLVSGSRRIRFERAPDHHKDGR